MKKKQGNLPKKRYFDLVLGCKIVLVTLMKGSAVVALWFGSTISLDDEANVEAEESDDWNEHLRVPVPGTLFNTSR